LPQLFAKILFQQMPQGLSNAVNWIQSELLIRFTAQSPLENVNLLLREPARKKPPPSGGGLDVGVGALS
jgi:hypothetical protein